MMLLRAAVIGLYRYFGAGNRLVQEVGADDIFTDSAVYPALSPRAHAGIYRGGKLFFGRGDVYVRLLPSGDAVQLTHDGVANSARVLSRRVAYRLRVGYPWDTWVSRSWADSLTFFFEMPRP